MIDLTRFTREQTAVVPVLNNRFQYNRKKYEITHNSGIENGWYRVNISGNDASIIEPVFIETEKIKAPVIKGYTYNNRIIFQNFDVAGRKLKLDIWAELNGNNAPPFSSIEAIAWEDKQLYYYRPNYSDVQIYEVKSLLDSNESLPPGKKGITPELKTLFLFHAVEQLEMKEALEKARREEAEEDYRNSFPGRLASVFNRVGAQITGYSLSGSRITVDWKLSATGTTFNSVINAESFSVVEAGYCMSGDDRRHTVSSLVITAQDYENQDLIYRTR
ncbi:MAG: hypothetical protein GY750_04145 [Lentisphaerae bacterium]|nr:hypothetical protein [Lentisphaerota bacterium]